MTGKFACSFEVSMVIYEGQSTRNTRKKDGSVSTPSNMNISATSGPIAIKFELKHHLGVGNDALSFGLDRIRTGFHGNR